MSFEEDLTKALAEKDYTRWEKINNEKINFYQEKVNILQNKNNILQLKIQKVKPVSIPRTSLAAGTSDYDQKYLGDLMKRSNKDMEIFAERILYKKQLQNRI